MDVTQHVDVLELESSAAIFNAGLSRLGRKVEQLENRIEVLEHANSALKGSLEASGVLRPEAFLARLHQNRFSSTLSRHPCNFEAGFSNLLLSQELRMVIGGFAGWNVVRSCSAAEVQLRELKDKISHVVYVCGGFDGNEILSSMVKFDPTQWESKDIATGASAAESSPGPSSEFCLSRKTSHRQDKLALHEQHLDGMMDVTQGAWEPVAPMAQRRAGFAAAAFSGLLYVCGGYDGVGFLRSAERFHPAPEKGVWEPIAPMNNKRHCGAAATLDGRFYVCGGYNGEVALSSTESYDPVTNTWELMAPMSHRRHGAAAAVLDGKIYVCGGNSGSEALYSAERYDLERGVWEDLPNMKFKRTVPFAVVLDNKVYVCSGCNGTETLNTMECFDPALNAWEVAPPADQRRHGAAAAVAGGKLFVCGGGSEADSPGAPLPSVECFNPSTCVWRSATAMKAARMDMAAVSLFAPT
jgi:N-acetylneuraminic acid mutarotase